MKTTDITATLALIGVIGLAFHAFKKGATDEAPILTDAVVAFESVGCPAGWTTHSKSEGRFLVSAGKYDDDYEFKLFERNGNIRHLHTGRTEEAKAGSGEDDDDHARTGAHSHAFTTKENTHLPPYYVVTFCKRKN